MCIVQYVHSQNFLKLRADYYSLLRLTPSGGIYNKHLTYALNPDPIAMALQHHY